MLKRETFFNYNRIYLLVTSGLSLLLPFIKLESFRKVISQEYFIGLSEVNLNNAIDKTLEVNQGMNTVSFTNVLQAVLYLGMLFAFTMFLFKILKLIRLIYKNPKHRTKTSTIVTVIDSASAFSFFHYVFIGDQLKLEEKQNILAHECIHVKERHTLDLIVFELHRIVFWFNPLVYIYQNRIATLHEFIADSKTVKNAK